ncbi:MAG: hypothetical protein H6739_06280 [Alphaproteobacteria bacterium]|nr:hypothetical protein [Alphaproteobacteria bacterium]
MTLCRLLVVSLLALSGCGSDGGSDSGGDDAVGLVFAGERDGASMTLGTSSLASFADVAGATAEDGDTLLGAGTMTAAGFSFEAGHAGVYEADLDATWVISLEAETVVAWFVLNCGGDGTVIHEEVVMHSLGNANASAVQSHNPFNVTTLVEVQDGGTITCVLQHKLEVAGTGDGILFHGVDGYTSGTARYAAE